MKNIQAQASGKKRANFWVFAAFVASKGAVIIKALKVLKYAKFAITAITMSISAILYGFAFGSWYFAVGLTLLLLIHEYGHVIAMMRKGIRASAPVFIPFLGAAVFAEIPKKKEDEAYIGYGGPLLGTVGALLCIAAAFALPEGSFNSTLLHILGNVGLFINLFNLIPARPLDGGRILHVLGGGVVYCGFVFLLALAFMTGDLFFVVIALFSVGDMPVRILIRYLLWGFMFTAGCIEAFFSLENDWLNQLLFYFFAAFSLLAFGAAWNTRAEPLDIIPEESAAPLWVKIRWFACYLALFGVIVGTMAWHSQYLPKDISESPLVRFVHKL
jgi:Zn-dependent protease